MGFNLAFKGLSIKCLDNESVVDEFSVFHSLLILLDILIPN